MDVTNFASINSPERHRRLNRGMSMPPQRKEQGIFGSPKAQHGPNHPAWWQALKGLGKRRRKSTTSAKAGRRCGSRYLMFTSSHSACGVKTLLLKPRQEMNPLVERKLFLLSNPRLCSNGLCRLCRAPGPRRPGG